LQKDKTQFKHTLKPLQINNYCEQFKADPLASFLLYHLFYSKGQDVPFEDINIFQNASKFNIIDNLPKTQDDNHYKHYNLTEVLRLVISHLIKNRHKVAIN
jgi:hypothetical protein